MNKLYIVMPAYNEEENIRAVVEQWYPIIEKHNENSESRLVIINDGSKDNTYSIMQKIALQYPLFVPLTKENGGHGATVLFGYHYALENGANYIFQTDSDGQTDPREFEEFWEQRKDYDMLIGHRNKREDGSNRVLVTKVLKIVLRLCFGVSIIDANTPYRLMKAETLKRYISLVPKDFNLSNVIISVIYAKKQLKVKYIPISFRQRQGGENSINFKKICGIGKQAIKDFMEIKRVI